MKWRQKVEEWKAGKYLVNDTHTNVRFIYETSVCDPNEEYDEVFVRYPVLDRMIYDPMTYNTYIQQSNNPYATYFNNLSGDAILVIPMPVIGPPPVCDESQFTTIKEFMDTATIDHQAYFWQTVGSLIEQLWNQGRVFYVSTHGAGVGYFHLRICNTPKYYQTRKFIRV